MGFFDAVDDFFKDYADSPGGILFEIFCVLYCFFALAIVCDEYLAPALETLCIRWGVREDVAGATFLAFGSAAPEIVINAVTTIKSQVTTSNTTSLGISAIIGSGMLAFSFIPSMCCFSSELELKLKRRPLLRDESFYLIALFTLCAAFHDGKIVVEESIFLILVYVGHLATVITSPWVRKTYRHKVKGIDMKPTDSQQSFVHKAREQLQKQRSLKKAQSVNNLIIPTTPGDEGDMDTSKPPMLKRAATTNTIAVINTGNVNYEKDANFGLLTGYDLRKQSEDNGLNTSMARPNDDDSYLSTEKSTLDSYYGDNNGMSSVQINDTMETRLLDDGDEHDDNEHNKNKLQRQITTSSTSIRTDSDWNDDDDEDHSLNSDDSDEGARTLIGIAMHWITMPLQILFKCTCPPAGEGDKCESLYGLTFFISVVHVAIFSFILSSVIGAWVDAWGMPQALFGMLLIAIGAEIPDTIESVTMAKKGYGSMAVSNCQGTQVINIGIGLGLPWLLTNLTGNEVIVSSHEILQVSAFFQTFIVCTNFFLLVGLAMIKKKNKAQLQPWKAKLLIALYFCTLFGFTLYLYLNNELFN